MDIRAYILKFFIIFIILLSFIISSCSKPSEDQEEAGVKTDKTTTVKVEPSAAKIPKPEAPEPEALKPLPEPAVESKPEKSKNISGLADVIRMETIGYAKHKKGIVHFSHKNHFTDYKLDCSECHHDKNGVPLKGLNEKAEVQPCISCHKKPGQAPKKINNKKLSQKEKLAYHAEALHKNCITCHKDFDKKNHTKAAPFSCSKCHPKRE